MPIPKDFRFNPEYKTYLEYLAIKNEISVAELQDMVDSDFNRRAAEYQWHFEWWLEFEKDRHKKKQPTIPKEEVNSNIIRFIDLT